MLTYSQIKLQDGPIREVGKNGDQIDDVLRFVRDRLREFNLPPHSNRETSLAITHIEEAMHWLDARTLDRMERGVEGTNQP